jgi:cell division protein FtsB
MSEGASNGQDRACKSQDETAIQQARAYNLEEKNAELERAMGNLRGDLRRAEDKAENYRSDYNLSQNAETINGLRMRGAEKDQKILQLEKHLENCKKHGTGIHAGQKRPREDGAIVEDLQQQVDDLQHQRRQDRKTIASLRADKVVLTTDKENLEEEVADLKKKKLPNGDKEKE